MENNQTKRGYFTKVEITIYIVSIFAICAGFLLAKSKDIVSLIASLIGATALIFVAKGNVTGQILTVIFSIFYGIISYSLRYYGEMITYLCMTSPIAIASIVTWLKNPYKGKKSQVKVNILSRKEWIIMFFLSIAVTIIFYFILKAFNNANLLLSTLSIFTSFSASYLTLRRSEYYGFAYATNDLVLILLWILATIKNSGYISMVICFVIFLCNDIYGFINWRKMKNLQK